MAKSSSGWRKCLVLVAGRCRDRGNNEYLYNSRSKLTALFIQLHNISVDSISLRLRARGQWPQTWR